jgi:hypothetical protein
VTRADTTFEWECECPRCGGTGYVLLLGTAIEVECPDCDDVPFEGTRITGEEFPHE